MAEYVEVLVKACGKKAVRCHPRLSICQRVFNMFAKEFARTIALSISKVAAFWGMRDTETVSKAVKQDRGRVRLRVVSSTYSLNKAPDIRLVELQTSLPRGKVDTTPCLTGFLMWTPM